MTDRSARQHCEEEEEMKRWQSMECVTSLPLVEGLILVVIGNDFGYPLNIWSVQVRFWNSFGPSRLKDKIWLLLMANNKYLLKHEESSSYM